MSLIDLSSVYEEAKDIAEEELDNLTEKGLEKLKKLTPEDEFELQKHNKRTGVKKKGTKLTSTIYNNCEHAEYVEYSKKTKKYYKNSGRRKGGTPFTTGKGAGMFRKTKFYLENEE